MTTNPRPEEASSGRRRGCRGFSGHDTPGSVVNVWRRGAMTTRAQSELLLVGSLPADSTEEAFQAGAELFADLVFALPDGETGPRRAWPVHIADRERKIARAEARLSAPGGAPASDAEIARAAKLSAEEVRRGTRRRANGRKPADRPPERRARHPCTISCRGRHPTLRASRDFARPRGAAPSAGQAARVATRDPALLLRPGWRPRLPRGDRQTVGLEPQAHSRRQLEAAGLEQLADMRELDAIREAA